MDGRSESAIQPLPEPELAGEPDPSPETIAQLIDLRNQELQVRAQELRLAERDSVYQHEYALKALDAGLKDREKDREQQKSNRSGDRMLVALFGVLAFFLVAYALHLGKEDFAREVFKALLYGVPSGAAGYGLGRIRAAKAAAAAKDDG